MEIWLYKKDNGRRSSGFCFPTLPEKIRVSDETSYQEFSIISKGSVKIPKGMNPTSVSWDGTFFGPSKANESWLVKRGQYKTPTECETILRKWQTSGQILQLIATDCNINMDVTISKFDCDNTGGLGNKDYSIEFAQYRELKIYTTDELKIVKYTKPRPAPAPAPSAPANKGNYTVKSGDCLWNIARKYYGNGTLWTKIRDANMGTIQSWCNRYNHGNTIGGTLIYPGEVLTIPN